MLKVYYFIDAECSEMAILLSAKPSRQHVFHVEYPHEWKRHNLVRLFKDVGKHLYVYQNFYQGQNKKWSLNFLSFYE